MSNNAPPANWFAISYDDTSWGVPVDLGTSGTVPGAHALWTSNPALAIDEEALSRTRFILPAGTPTHCDLELFCNDYVLQVWMNNTQIVSSPIGDYVYRSISVPVNLLLPGAANELAIWVRNANDLVASTLFKLTVT